MRFRATVVSVLLSSMAMLPGIACSRQPVVPNATEPSPDRTPEQVIVGARLIARACRHSVRWARYTNCSREPWLPGLSPHPPRAVVREARWTHCGSQGGVQTFVARISILRSAAFCCRGSSTPSCSRKLQCRWVGPWRSLVARFLGVEEVPSSNLGGPTNLLNNLVTSSSARGSINIKGSK